jgi:hypothetical protein
MSGNGITTAWSLANPPDAPGSLTRAPAPSAVLEYLTGLGAWHDQLRGALNELDRCAQASSDPTSFTGDITLAMSMCESIDRRLADITIAWDSGRVQGAELSAIAQLIWGRLPDPLGNPSAFSLSEATTLAAALEARLADRLGAAALTNSGVTARIGPLRDTLARCVTMSATLGRRAGEAEAMGARLEELIGGSPGGDGGAALATGFDELADRAELLERDLIKETSLRASVQAAIARIAAQRAELAAQHTLVTALAQRCRDKIASPPRLAIPDASVLGSGPSLPDGAGDPGAWTAAEAEAADFDRRLGQVAAGLAEVNERYGAALSERSDLRGLLDGYHDRALKAGLAESGSAGSGDLVALYDQAHQTLWTAPCNLEAARPQVAAYQRAVLERLGVSRGAGDAT